MAVLSKTKSHPKQVPFKIYSNNLTNRLHINNQQKYIDCLKPRSNQNERVCKKCGCDHFYVPIIKVFHL